MKLACVLSRKAIAGVLVAACCAAASLAITGTALAVRRIVPHGSVVARPADARTLDGRFGGLRGAPLTAVPRVGWASARWQARGDGSAGAVLDGSPGYQPAVNTRTGTLYVPIQCTNPATGTTCADTASHVVDVISTAKCAARVTSGCRVIARADAGAGAFAAVVDPVTDTVYVANDIANTVTVIDGARCNAHVTSGCAHSLATFKVGGLPSAIALNPDTHTLYTANYATGNISVVPVAGCNAQTTSGCGKPVRTISDKLDPDGVAVDLATDTVYAANDGATGNGDTVSVINGATCNGSTATGCAQRPRTITVGSGPFFDVVDQATGTVYTANYNAGTVSVIDGAACSALVHSGCGQSPRAVTTGAGVGFVGIDAPAHTLFAMNQEDGTMSEINTRTCNGLVATGCPQRARNEQVIFDSPTGYNPNAFALAPQTGTAYMVNGGGQNFMAPIGISGCDAASTSGCRVEAPSVPDPEFLTTVDTANHTIYAGSDYLAQIDVINGATCHASDLSGCAPVATIPVPYPGPNVGDIDPATDTLYAGDGQTTGILAVIDTATCNAEHTAGCSQHPAEVRVGAYPEVPVVNPTTGTVYVSYGEEANHVAVVNGATCNATVQSGCNQVPGVVSVGIATAVLAVSPETDTVYAPGSGASFSGDTVALINGATCNGTDHAGCSHVAATIKVGLGPSGVAVNEVTDTVYVSDNANGDLPGELSVIDGATCNATDTSGCGHIAAVPTGRSPLFVAVDPGTDTVYVADFSSAAVTVVNGAHCNGTTSSGCATAGRLQAVGSQPVGVAFDPANGTVYVTQIFQSGSMAVFGVGGP